MANPAIPMPHAVRGCDAEESDRGSFVPQFELLDLARRGLRQLAEDDVLRALVMGQVVAAEGDNFVLRGFFAGLQLDEGTGRLAPFVVRLGDHGGEHHGRVLGQRVLHFDGGMNRPGIAGGCLV